MTDNNEELLRRSLHAVDTHRSRLIIGIVAGLVLLVASFVFMAHSVHESTAYFIHTNFVVLLVWTGLLTLVVVLQITAMTKKILRAIELATKK